MDKITGVYLIRNTINDKCYVGSSRHILRRWYAHRNQSTWRRCDSDLYKDFRIYGRENFTLTILEECSENELLGRERFYIEHLGTIENGYNKNLPYVTEEEYKTKYKKYKDQYNKEHSKQHTLYMRAYRKKSA